MWWVGGLGVSINRVNRVTVFFAQEACTAEKMQTHTVCNEVMWEVFHLCLDLVALQAMLVRLV